jgi:serine/threonine protein kinase
MALPSPCPAIAGFVALRFLGSGQFGDVFLVQRTRDARLFAAKVPRGSGDSDAQEALLLQQLQHPNIVHCEEVLRVDNGRRLVIVMEYAAMGDLEEYLRGFAQRYVLLSVTWSTVD